MLFRSTEQWPKDGAEGIEPQQEGEPCGGPEALGRRQPMGCETGRQAADQKQRGRWPAGSRCCAAGGHGIGKVEETLKATSGATCGRQSLQRQQAGAGVVMAEDPLHRPTPRSQILGARLRQSGTVAEAPALHTPEPRPRRGQLEQGAGQGAQGAADGIALQDALTATAPQGQPQHLTAGPTLQHPERLNRPQGGSR